MVTVQFKMMALAHGRGIFVQCLLVFLTTHCVHSQRFALNLKGKKTIFCKSDFCISHTLKYKVALFGLIFGLKREVQHRSARPSLSGV